MFKQNIHCQLQSPDCTIFYNFVKINASDLSILTHLFLMHPFSTPYKNIRKCYGFLMLSGGRERVHWEEMG